MTLTIRGLVQWLNSRWSLYPPLTVAGVCPPFTGRHRASASLRWPVPFGEAEPRGLSIARGAGPSARLCESFSASRREIARIRPPSRNGFTLGSRRRLAGPETDSVAEPQGGAGARVNVVPGTDYSTYYRTCKMKLKGLASKLGLEIRGDGVSDRIRRCCAASAAYCYLPLVAPD